MQYNAGMKSRTVNIGSRGLHVLNPHYEIEKKLIAQLEELWANNKCVSRTVIFWLVLELDPNFQVSGGEGGRGSAGHMDRLKTWFYYGFKKRHRLSNRKIASIGIGQKLPDRWQEKLRTQQQRVAAAQFPQTVKLGNDDDDDETETVNVPGIDDTDWYNFDHVPVWQEPVRTYSWGKKDSGRRNVKTAGREKEKNCYTVVLCITKDGKKRRPLIIFKFKGATAKKGEKCGNSASITYEIKNNLPDKYGNEYPSRQKCYIIVSKTANSSGELTVVYLKKVPLPAAGVNRDADAFPRHIGVLCDDFKGHSAAECKAFTRGNNKRKKMLKWEIMPGGLTPVAQPLDKVVNKAWDKVPEELCAKAWTACGYKTKDQLCGDNETAIVEWNDVQVDEMVQTLIGSNNYMTYGAEPELVIADRNHPEEGDSDYSDPEE
eukprot:scaffold120055_cov77-Cyclotella_meneghiniana.AAC.2